MNLYRDLQEGEIIRQGDRILTTDAGFQPVRVCIGQQYSSDMGFVIQRPIDEAGKNVFYAEPIINNKKTDTEIVTQIIRSIRWQDLHQQDSSDMLNFLMNRHAAITMSEIASAIDSKNKNISIIQADSYRAVFNTDCIIKMLSDLIKSANATKETKKPWYKIW